LPTSTPSGAIGNSICNDLLCCNCPILGSMMTK
jgi:hypothetical protein